jgi:hypothetical protein
MMANKAITEKMTMSMLRMHAVVSAAVLAVNAARAGGDAARGFTSPKPR